MSKKFLYDYEKFSPIDIVHFVHEKGFQTIPTSQVTGGGPGYEIEDAYMSITLGHPNYAKKIEQQIFVPSFRIYWKNYKCSDDKKNEFEELFTLLKKKFQLKEPNKLRTVKDPKELERLINSIHPDWLKQFDS
jgi:hypothetical protein